MYTLHAMPDSASTIIRMALAEMGLPHALRALNREAGDLDSPAYRAISPFGLVPVLETPDGAIFETGAILLWLADRHGALAPAPTSPERAAFMAWFVFVANTLHPTAMALIYPDRPAGEAAAPAAIAAAHSRLRDQLSHLDRAPLGSSVSVLTLYIAVILRWIAVFAADPAFAIRVADFPNLAALARRLEQRPQIAAIAANEGLGRAPFTAP